MACGIKVNLKKQEISGPKGRAVRQAAEKLAVALSGVLRQGCRSNHLSINLRDCSSGKGKRAWRVGIYGLGKANWSGDNMDWIGRQPRARSVWQKHCFRLWPPPG